MAKPIKNTIKMQVPAGKANPAPPLGPVLGQAGVNIQDFCTRFNGETSNHPLGAGAPLTVVLTVYEDRSFDFEIRQPPMAYLIKKELGIQKGSGEPNKNKVAKITRAQAENVAKIKMEDLNCHGNVDSAVEIIFGQARSMGIERAA